MLISVCISVYTQYIQCCILRVKVNVATKRAECCGECWENRLHKDEEGRDLAERRTNKAVDRHDAYVS